PDTAAPLTSRYHDERLEVIYAYVRCRIFTEPALTFLSQGYDCVMALLNDDNLDLVNLEKNWNAVRTLRVHDIKDAVDDVLWANKEGDYLMVLEPRLSRRPAFSRWGAKELILAGFIPNNIPLSSPWHSIICTDSDSQLFGSMWEETKRNLSLYDSLSLDDAEAQAFVNGSIQHPELSRTGSQSIADHDPEYGIQSVNATTRVTMCETTDKNCGGSQEEFICKLRDREGPGLPGGLWYPRTL
ncbi:hypothetical protein BDR06DRAFT_1070426, partial [Suillus hirtellus]